MYSVALTGRAYTVPAKGAWTAHFFQRFLGGGVIRLGILQSGLGMFQVWSGVRRLAAKVKQMERGVGLIEALLRGCDFGCRGRALRCQFLQRGQLALRLVAVSLGARYVALQRVALLLAASVGQRIVIGLGRTHGGECSGFPGSGLGVIHLDQELSLGNVVSFVDEDGLHQSGIGSVGFEVGDRLDDAVGGEGADDIAAPHLGHADRQPGACHHPHRIDDARRQQRHDDPEPAVIVVPGSDSHPRKGRSNKGSVYKTRGRNIGVRNVAG